MNQHYKKYFILSGLFFSLMAYSSLMDVYHDGQDSLSRAHITMEIFTLVLSLAAALFFVISAIKITKENEDLTKAIKTENAQKEHYRKQVLQYSEGLSQAIDAEFSKWELTKTEKTIGLLVLKGLSTKQIAELQGAQDKTIRQHCSAIYKKSGLGGRSELSAYFLEDLLVNPQPS